MQLEPGMRVRCKDAGRNVSIVTGGEYHIRSVANLGDEVFLNEVPRMMYSAWRFKPVVRVKAPTSRLSNLEYMVDRAVAAFKAMTPEQQQAEQLKQRESWARGEMGNW